MGNPEIKNRPTGAVIVEAGKYANARAAVEESKADLRGADLMGADLRKADLRGADLRGAGLSFADLRKADLREADLRGAGLSFADLRKADLREADLRVADLREADLREADLDFSSWPLWCGSIGAKVDKRIAIQLLCHAAAVEVVGDDEDSQIVRNMQRAVFKVLWEKFHRKDECKGYPKYLSD